MTSTGLNERWRDAMVGVLRQLEVELPGGERGATGAKGTGGERRPSERARQTKLGAGKSGHPEEVFEYHALLLVNYSKQAAELESVYDGMVHPQKRRHVRVVLDALLGRISELWAWLVSFEGRNPPSLDPLLADLKLSWHALDVPVPRYFRDEHAPLLSQRDELLDALLAQKAEADAAAAAAAAASDAADAAQAAGASGAAARTSGAAALLAASDAAAAAAVARRAAAAVVRRAERARARRVVAARAAEAAAAGSRRAGLTGNRGGGGRSELVGGDGFVDVEAASNLITKVARGHLVRREVDLLRDEELQLLGMVREDRRETDVQQAALDAAARAKKKAVQADHEAEYLAALVDVKRRIYEEDGPLLKEEMEDQIRRWFLSHLRQTGKWPDFPSEAAGGSAKIFFEPPATVTSGLARDDDGRSAGRAPAARARPTFGRGRGADSDEDKIPIPPSAYLGDLQARVASYMGEWQDKDEADNFEQRHDEDIIRAAARPVVETELRAQVDEVMRVELEGIKIKFTGKKKKKRRKKAAAPPPRHAGVGARPAKPDPATASGGPGPAKPSRARKSRDPTAAFSTEELYGELVLAGIVVKATPGELGDFVGDVSHLAATLKAAGIEPDPSYADVRRSVALNAILPLGSPALASKGAGTKGVLLAGPPGAGKSMLAARIAWLTGANVFDLSPANMAGKFPGKAVSLALHKVFKVAKAMAPSVILLDNVDLIFTPPKRLPPAHRGPGGPRRYRKALLKYAKTLKPASRVLCVGTSASPWAADHKSLMRLFPTVVHIPRPDYPTRALLWRTFIEAKGLFLPDAFDLSTLARISDGYLAGPIAAVVDAVVTPHRARSLPTAPLTVDEFVRPLASATPLFAEDDAKWRKWLAKLPLAKLLKQRKDEAAAAAAEAAKNARFRRR